MDTIIEYVITVERAHRMLVSLNDKMPGGFHGPSSVGLSGPPATGGLPGPKRQGASPDQERSNLSFKIGRGAPRTIECLRKLASMAHVRQSRPDSGLFFQGKVLKTFKVV